MAPCQSRVLAAERKLQARANNHVSPRRGNTVDDAGRLCPDTHPIFHPTNFQWDEGTLAPMTRRPKRAMVDEASGGTEPVGDVKERHVSTSAAAMEDA